MPLWPKMMRRPLLLTNELRRTVIVTVVLSLSKDAFTTFMPYVLIPVLTRFDYGSGKHASAVLLLLG